MGLDVVELIMTIEEHYDLRISDDEARTMRTVGDLHGYILIHARPVPESRAVWEWLQIMLERDFGVPKERITPDASVVRDLGID